MISDDDVRKIEEEEARRLERLGFGDQEKKAPPVAKAPDSFDAIIDRSRDRIIASICRIPRWIRFSACALVVVGLWCLATFTSCHDRRSDHGDSWTVTETNLWGTPRWEQTSRNDETFNMLGPVTPKGTKHGKWLLGVPGRWTVQWYWYGKTVTEEDFERLSDGH